MSIIEKLGFKKPPQNILRVAHPDGSLMEIRTSGNIDFSGEYRVADPNYKLESFSDSMESYAKFFSEAKPGPSSAAE